MLAAIECSTLPHCWLEHEHGACLFSCVYRAQRLWALYSGGNALEGREPTGEEPPRLISANFQDKLGTDPIWEPLKEWGDFDKDKEITKQAIHLPICRRKIHE